MNKYFLIIAVLQLWPLITPVNPLTTWGPLLFIFAVTSIKEAWDDLGRWKMDKEANQKRVWITRDARRVSVSRLYSLNGAG
jgi:phospholipid-translocating ATPase